MAFNGTGSNVTSLNAANISSGTINTARLASGTANSTTFLRGDSTWQTIQAGGGLTNNVRQAITSSATTTININSGNVVDLTMASNITTLAFSNVPASGTPLQLVIIFKSAADGTNYQVTWPASIYWNNTEVDQPSTGLVGPTFAVGANTVTVIALLTTDGGTKWKGWVEASIQGNNLSPSINSIYSWGTNGNGQLGQNNQSNRSSPVQVGSLEVWTSIGVAGLSGRLAGGVLNNGKLYMWGDNSLDQLGLGPGLGSPITSPRQVGALTNWAKVSVSDQFSVAIKTDGTLWAWGDNNYGQLGQNNTINRNSPVQIGALTNWAKVQTMFHGSVAIKTDGTLWSWGRGIQGQLGLGNQTNYSSPKQVGALTNWATLSTSSSGYNLCAAIKTDGTLWTWGRGNNGALGHGNTTTYSSPKQVGALTNWASVSIASETTVGQCAAIKTDGTLWTWGSGNNGALGLGNTTSYNSPKQVGVATDWSKIAMAAYVTAAVKTNGTLWAWGRNNEGQLGQLNLISRSSPTQVGAEIYWGNVSAGGTTVFGLRATPAVNPA
jgi:alpha-tubulin suppressor-like RCC1 family protein